MFSPILITAFNRPNRLQDLLESLIDSPCKIYVALDAAKIGDTKNEILVQKSREIINRFEDRLSDVRISNLSQGCFLGVTNAISWAFSKETQLIILEEDIQISESFLIFVSSMLEIYKDVPNVGSIAGMNLVPQESVSDTKVAFRFSAFTSSWGWGTWRDRWEDYEKDLKEFPHTEFIYPTGFWTRSKKHYWSKVFSSVAEGNTDSWAYRWLYSNWKNNRLTLIPNENLALNVGFDAQATHTRDSVIPWWLPTEINYTFRASLFPNSITRDFLADNWMEKNHFRTDPMQQLRHTLGIKFPKMRKVYGFFKKGKQ